MRDRLPEAPTGDAFTEHTTDRDLLRRFSTNRDAAAFEAALRRHGSMVLRVCRRVLDRGEDVEDTFQATFLTLARKAQAVTWRESVAAWLYEVSYRLAREVRRRNVRRQVREARAPVRDAADPLDEITGRELLTAIDEELASLPEEYRAPLLLCCLEGVSGEEAARQLGYSASTLKRRLHAARERLRSQLQRRGLDVPVVTLVTLLACGAGAAAIPPALATNTVLAATLVGTGSRLAAGLASARAVDLAGLAPVAGVKPTVGLAVLGGVAATLILGLGYWFKNDPAAPSPALERPAVGRPAVAAVVETTLPTASGQIRQFAFDANPQTYFAGRGLAGTTDHFTLVFDAPVRLSSVRIQTGKPGGGEELEAGTVEVSADGTTFEPAAGFQAGTARYAADGRTVRAVRVRPTDRPQPLVVREFEIASDPPVAAFRYPVEFAVDVSDAPEMRPWAERAARVCERQFPVICDELMGDGFVPPTMVPLVIRKDAPWLAGSAGGRVIGSAGYFRANPDDVGALVHSAVYVVQRYPADPPAPRWLSQGIADYIRFFKYEPGRLDPLNPDLARCDGSSRETAAFLAFLVARYDPRLVNRLNAILRAGRYDEGTWQALTGKALWELEAEWRASLPR